jgi:hypothetical protein
MCAIHLVTFTYQKIENVFVANEKIGKSFISNVFMTMTKNISFKRE